MAWVDSLSRGRSAPYGLAGAGAGVVAGWITVDRSLGDIGLMGSCQAVVCRKYRNAQVAAVSSRADPTPTHPLCGPVSFSVFSAGILQM